MATQTAPKPVHCSTCGEILKRIVAGNIIDYMHRDGTHQCTRIAPYLAA